MELDRYRFKASKNLRLYKFISEGPRGKIPKRVQYCKTNVINVYNLEFGDEHPITGKIDDLAISNNGDSSKILATVASTIYSFTTQYPSAYIYFTGSTKARTRLYRMGISNNLVEISRNFEVYGLSNNEWTSFEKKTEYDAFLIKRKLI